MKYALSFAILLFFTHSITAQTDFKSRYDNKSIYLQSKVFSGLKVIQGDQVMTRKQFEPEFLRFDNSALEYTSFKKNKSAGLWTYFGGFAALFAAAVVVEDNNALGAGLYVGSAGMLIFSMGKLIKSGNSLSKSVWHYNREVLLAN